MYFPIGWPKAINLSIPGETAHINHICCDAVKILVAAIADSFIGIWYANPLIPIAFYRRTAESVAEHGCNRLAFWKPDSRSLAILTNSGTLLLYQINFESNNNGILTQVDPPTSNLQRDSAELFIKENIPRLNLQEVGVYNVSTIITTVCCISFTELLLATEQCQLVRLQWSQLEEAMDSKNVKGEKPICAVVDLRSMPFYVNQQCSVNCLPTIGSDAFVAALEYSPLIGGCAAVFSDRRAAFLIANHLRFETQNMHGFWVPDVEDATTCCVNHKYRLLAYGRRNSDVHLYAIEDKTGGLEFSHRLSISASVMPGTLGAVNELKWSPDGCVLAVTWLNGGISLWSTFGALLMSSLNWDFGLHVDLLHHNPLQIQRLEWSTEGYQLFMSCKPQQSKEYKQSSNVLQLSFVKSTLSTNPCMASHAHVLLQGDHTLYLNQGDNLETIYFGSKCTFPNNQSEHVKPPEENMELKKSVDITSILSESKYWTVLQLPLTYASTNWPIRYSAIDAPGFNLAVAGRTGFAHYSMLSKKWKLFGNESQEKDFVVSGGLLWWKGFVVMGCFSLIDRTDEIRCYPGDCKLDNQFGNKIQVRAPVISLNMFRDQLIALTTDGIVSLFLLQKRDAYTLNVECAFELDVRSVCVHPACIVSLTVTNLRNDVTSKASNTASNSNLVAETIILNVCGRILMVQREPRSSVINSMLASCLASCVECFWLSNSLDGSPMSDCLWLYSGAHGMRVWLPILPPSSSEQLRNAPQRLHTFMSKRIMLSFPLKLYPLVILFDNVIVLGVENETTLYTNEASSHFSLPFSLLERKSQVYLHKILRQLIKRNLGYSAWEIAKSCRELPYFPHSLELLLHEVLEEEATSKEPIPDALLPSVLDFIREFPVYLQTIVQCARKTEIALWPYLFSIAGKPKDLFQSCLQYEELETAASYLIILQNLEPSIISKQYATLLLDIALQNRKWELAKDLIRFLKAIDPNEIDSPRSSMIVNLKIAPPTQNQSQVNQNSDVFNLVLGPIARERSFSTTVTSNLPKDKKDKSTAALANSTTAASVSSTAVAHENNTTVGGNNNNSNNNVNGNNVRRRSERSNSTKERKETFCIETILQRHARSLLQKHKLLDLGYMSAFLDFHMVTWLSQETERAAKLDDFVEALTCLHEELCLPTPFAQQQTCTTEAAASSTADYTQLQRQFLLDNNRANMQHSSSQTSESGYFSLALMDTPTSTSNGNCAYNHIAAIKEEVELPSTGNYKTHMMTGEYYKSRSNSQISFENARYLQLCSQQNDTLSFGLDYVGNIEFKAKELPEKLGIKIRYLLQLFVEANCTDYALVLSILLQDAASIGRIINVVIRSESLATCRRIETALKRLTQWSFDRECTYRCFMLTLQPYIYLLEQYISASSNSSGIGIAGNNLSNTRKSDISVESCEAVANERHRDSLSSLCQPGTVINLNGNWPLDKYQHERHARISRQNSVELAGFDANAQMANGNQKNTHKDKLVRNETHSCALM